MAIEIKGKEEPQDIYELIKAGDVVTRIDASIAKGLTRFVGRKNSMAALMEVYDKVKSGLGQVVGVVGEAGVGKSRLILEFINSIINDNHTYLEGQCLQYGGSILYKPILDILKSFFDVKDNDREFIIKKKIKIKVLKYTNLEQAIPSFQDLLSVKVDDENFLKLEPKQKREKAFESIRDLLISISQEKPLIVVVEDLHWIDDSSEEFLNYLIEWIANTPIMLILLYRTEYQQKWGSKTYYHKAGLDHLGKESAVELVKAMLEDGDVSPELRDLILARAAGNPLFMEEFTQALVENGTIKKQDNQYILSRRITEIHVPDTVQSIIAARMDRLEENLKRTMQVASVIGRDFAFSILQTITGMRDELKSYLLNLQGLEFIYEKRLFPELEYIFKHALTQEVAYNSLLLKRRKQIHENIGKAIEDLYAERLEEFYETLAYHYSRSGNLEKAVHYFNLSGIKVYENYANQESYSFYKEALDLLDRLPDTIENKKKKIEISISISKPMSHLGYPEGSLDILQNWEELSKEIGDKKSLSTFYASISFYYVLKENPAVGIKYIEPRFIEAKKDKDIDVMAPLSYGLSTLYSLSGYCSKIVDFLPEVIELIEKTGRQNEDYDMPFNAYQWIYLTLGHAFTFIGNFEKAASFLEKGLGLGIKKDDRHNKGLYSHYCSDLNILKGHGRKAIKHSRNTVKFYEKIHNLYMIPFSRILSGWGYYLLGNLETAMKHAEQGYAMINDISVTGWIYNFPCLLSLIHHDSGDMAAAQRSAEEALEMSIKVSSGRGEGCSRIIFGRISGKMGGYEKNEAENQILQGIKILEELELRPYASQGYFYLGELHGDNGENDKALEWLKKAESEFQRIGMDYDLSQSKSLIGKTFSIISPAEFFQSEQIIFDAIKIAQDIESKPALAFGHLCLGEIYADDGQKEKALENLKKAETMYKEMGMGLWRGKTREVLDRIA